MKTIVSKSTNQPIDIEQSFLKIREILNELEFSPGKETPFCSDNMDTAIATFDTLVDALLFWYIHEGGDECMASNMSRAIQMNWYHLKEMIEARDNEHHRVCKLAMHGTEDPFDVKNQAIES